MSKHYELYALSSPANVTTLTPLTGWMDMQTFGGLDWDFWTVFAIFGSERGRLVVETSEDGNAADAEALEEEAGTGAYQCKVRVLGNNRYVRISAYASDGLTETVRWSIKGTR